MTTDSSSRSARLLGLAAAVGLCFGAGSVLLQQPAPANATLPAAMQDEDDDLPSGREILERYIEATGGEDAYRDLRTMEVTGTFSLPAMGIQGRLQAFQQIPDQRVVVIDIPGMGQVQQGINRDFGWEISPMTGPRLMSEEEHRAMLRENDPRRALDPDEHYEEIEVEGVEEVGDKRAYRVRFKPKEAQDSYTAYYAVESGLLVRTVMTQETPMGRVAVEGRIEDYRPVGENGLLQPHRVVMSFEGMEQVMTLERVEINPDIPEDRFEPPASVKQLRERNQQQDRQEEPDGQQDGNGNRNDR